MPESGSSHGRAHALDAAMNRRRLELGMQWKHAAHAAGISEQSLRDIRTGRTAPRDLTIRRLEQALDWEPGSIRNVLDGGDPQPLPSEPRPTELVDGEATVGGREGEMKLARFTDLLGKLPPGRADAYLSGVIEGLKQLVPDEEKKQEDDSE